MKHPLLFCICVLALLPLSKTEAYELYESPVKHYMTFGAFTGAGESEISGGEIGYLASIYNIGLRASGTVYDTGPRAPIYQGYSFALLVQPNTDLAPYAGVGFFLGGRTRGHYDCRWDDDEDYCDREYETQGFAEGGLMYKGEHVFLNGYVRSYADNDRDFSETTVVGINFGYRLHYGFF